MYQTQNNEPLAYTRFQQACDASIRNATANTAYFRAGSPSQPALPFCSKR
jgi:hypothetical protein